LSSVYFHWQGRLSLFVIMWHFSQPDTPLQEVVTSSREKQYV
jgi:hypothetical protein